jgi:hypothetical protein
MRLQSSPAALPKGTQQIRYLPVDSIKTDDQNARHHPPAQLKALEKAVIAHGVVAPLLVDGDNKLLSGHARLLVCKRLGWTEVPTVAIEHLSPEQAKAFAIAENRISELARWDEKQLALRLKELSEITLDFDIEATGFVMAEIDLKIEGLGELDPDGAEPEEQAVAPDPAVCRPGDVWILGDHRIVCASALAGETYALLLNGDRVAAVFADPPYNCPVHTFFAKGKHRKFVAASGELSGPEFTAFLSTATRLAAEHSLPGSVHFWTIDWNHIHALLAVGYANYDELIAFCVWVKNNGGMGGFYRSAHELVAVFRHGSGPHRNNIQLGKYGRNRTNVWSYPGANTFMRSSEEADLLAQHPTPKPVALVADALLDVTVRGDLVLDGFLGSGSSLLACERIGRRCRGIELDPLYVDLAIRRWQRTTGEAAVLEPSGETFDALAALPEGRP